MLNCITFTDIKLNWFKDNLVNDLDYLCGIFSRTSRVIAYLQVHNIFVKYRVEYWNIMYDYLECLLVTFDFLLLIIKIIDDLEASYFHGDVEDVRL